MNVYDFDKTIFDGDCEEYFFAFMLRRKGWYMYWINYKVCELLYKLKLRSKTRTREAEYRFLPKVDDLDRALEDYWDTHQTYMMDWYLKGKQPTDVIATGSPRFLMEPIAKRLGGVGLVATDMDPRTGKIRGEFAVYEHKLAQFKKQFDPAAIDNFYSDDYSDHYLANCAKRAFVVRNGGQITEWNEFFSKNKRRQKSIH